MWVTEGTLLVGYKKYANMQFSPKASKQASKYKQAISCLKSAYRHMQISQPCSIWPVSVKWFGDDVHD